tara:strand:+ start:255 stop:890 length:636 start_codon:yes stop_codon:yes gene_type:complete
MLRFQSSATQSTGNLSDSRKINQSPSQASFHAQVNQREESGWQFMNNPDKTETERSSPLDRTIRNLTMNADRVSLPETSTATLEMESESMILKASFGNHKVSLLFLFMLLVTLPPCLLVLVFGCAMFLNDHWPSFMYSIFGPGILLLVVFFLVSGGAFSTYFTTCIVLGQIIFERSKNIYIRASVFILILLELPPAFWLYSTLFEMNVGWR